MDVLAEIMHQQAGVISRAQALEAGLAPHAIRRLLRRGQWIVVHPGVYVNHNGELTWLQRAWSAVLALWPAALCGPSALRAAEGPARRGRDDDTIHVAVPTERHSSGPPGVRVHRLAHLDARVQWNTSPPRLRYEEAALDEALAATDELAAIQLLASAVQTRRTTAARLLASLAGRPRARRRTWLVGVLTDIAEGTCSVLEHGYLHRVERAHGLPRGRRQRREVGRSGSIYRDVEYAGLIVELDGRLFHDSAGQRDRDFERDLDAAVDGLGTVRLSWGQVYARPCATARKIGLLLRRLGWEGEPRPCSPGCTLRGA